MMGIGQESVVSNCPSIVKISAHCIYLTMLNDGGSEYNIDGVVSSWFMILTVICVFLLALHSYEVTAIVACWVNYWQVINV